MKRVLVKLSISGMLGYGVYEITSTAVKDVVKELGYHFGPDRVSSLGETSLYVGILFGLAVGVIGYAILYEVEDFLRRKRLYR